MRAVKNNLTIPLRRVDGLKIWIWAEGLATRTLRRVRRVAWVVPCAHGTPTIKLWSFDVRSEGPTQSTQLKENERAWKVR